MDWAKVIIRSWASRDAIDETLVWRNTQPGGPQTHDWPPSGVPRLLREWEEAINPEEAARRKLERQTQRKPQQTKVDRDNVVGNEPESTADIVARAKREGRAEAEAEAEFEIRKLREERDAAEQGCKVAETRVIKLLSQMEILRDSPATLKGKIVATTELG